MIANYTTDVQMDYVKQRIISYFAQVAQITQTYSPPGTNASNGWVRTYMIDPTMDSFGSPPTLILDPGSDADVIFKAYITFFNLSKSAFVNYPNYHANIWDTADLLIADFIVKLSSDITTIVTDILAITSLDLVKITTLIDDIKKYISDVKAQGIVVRGNNMNGWIAVAMRTAAQTAVAPLSSGFKLDNNSTAGKVATILETALNAIANLSKGSPEQDHSNPWLKSDWEIQYHAIASSVATGIQNI